MNREDHELIEKNILGQASPEEQSLLESKLQQPDYRREYDEVVHLTKSLQVYERRRLLALLQQSERAESRRYFPLAIAASVALLLATTYLLWFREGSSHLKLYEQYYEPLTTLKIVKPRGPAEAYQIKIEAYKLYQEGDATSALAKLNPLLEEQPDDKEAILLKGLVHLHSGDYPVAITELRKVKEISSAQWYLALALLADGQTDESLEILRQVAADEGSPYQDQAMRLVDQLAISN